MNITYEWQFDKEHILVFFTENVGFSRFLGFFFGFFGFFGLFQNIFFVFLYFSENLGLFRFVTKQFCLFRLFRYRFEKLKQTEIIYFWFHETNRNKRETDLVSVCFGSNRNLFLFVSRTP